MFRLGSTAQLDPFRALAQMQQALDRVLDQPLQWWSSAVSGRGVFPPVNVFSGPDGSYVVQLQVPGLAAESIQVETQGDSLKISGKRALQAPASAGYVRRERWDGEFERALRLPDHLDLAAAQAQYRSGVLTLSIPVRAEAAARQIPVAGAQSQIRSGAAREA